MTGEMTFRINGVNLPALEDLDVEKMLRIGATQRIMKIAETSARSGMHVNLRLTRNEISLTVRKPGK